MLAITVDTVIKWLLGELIFLIYTFTFRKKLISVLIWFHYCFSFLLIQFHLSVISNMQLRRNSTGSSVCAAQRNIQS